MWAALSVMRLLVVVGAVAANRWLPLELYDYWSWQGARQPFLADPEAFLTFAGERTVRQALERRADGQPVFLFIVGHLNSEYRDPQGGVRVGDFARDLAGLLAPSLASQEALVLMLFVLGEQAAVFHCGATAKRRLTDEAIARVMAAGRTDLAENRYDAAFEKMVEALPLLPDAFKVGLFLAAVAVTLFGVAVACLTRLRQSRERRNDEAYYRPGSGGAWPVRPTPFSNPEFPAMPPSAPAQPTPFSHVASGQSVQTWPVKTTPFSEAANVLPVAHATPFSDLPQT